ncbi:unnamed protein product [Lota lota]
MRSRSSSLEDAAKDGRTRRSVEREEPPGRVGGRSRYREQPGDTGTVRRNRKTGRGTESNGGDRKEKGRDLSRDDLLFLLSMLEGELQARDEVITVLKAEKIDLALLEAKYGFVVPHQVLQALQRDGVQGKDHVFQEDIYEKPMAELDKLVEKQRETCRRMLDQLLRAEQSYKQALGKMEEDKQNHQEFMKKSDEFTNLLEQERERLKLLLDQEKAYQERKEEEHNKKVADLKEELTKLKSFALMVVDEQQRLNQQLHQQTAKVQELTAGGARAQAELTSAHGRLQEEEGKVSRLESELRDHARTHRQEQEAMAAKLSGEDAQNRALRQKLSTLSRQLDDLEETNKTLRRAEEELQELRDKMSRGEGGGPGLVEEVEELRRRVLEMEGKDEELIRMEEQCRDLHKKLEKEAGQSRSLKAEVEKLNRRITELEKLEDAFGKSKLECGSLRSNLEKEKLVSKVVASELDVLRDKVKELEAAESQLAKTEVSLKEDLTKLKTLTVMLVDERKTMAEKMRQMESKVQNSCGKLQAEQEMVNSVTEKLIEESKKALRSKAELEQKVCGATKERDELKARLRAEEEKTKDLDSKVSMMKKRLQSLESVEREYIRSKGKEEHITSSVAKRFQQEDNKVKDLSQEVERLRSKLKDMKVVEGDLLKTEELELLEKRFANEREKANALMEELETSRAELSNYQLAEKKECGQERALYKRLKEEEAKSSHLAREVAALKDKIHEFMGTEESICRMKNDHSAQQRKLAQQEVRNKELAREMESLTRELERYRRFSKSLRPGMSGRRFSDLHVSTKEVQTEPPDPQLAGQLGVAAANGKPYGEGELDHDENYDHGRRRATCGPALVHDARRLTNAAGARPPPLQSQERPRPADGKGPAGPNGSHVQQQQGDVVLSHGPGQPLHIKVTPDPRLNTALLEITGPAAETAPSYTSTAVIPTGGGGPAKQRITIIQNAKAVSPSLRSKRSPDRPASSSSSPPLTTVAYAPGSASPDRATSPVQIVSVTTGTPERAEVAGGRHAVIRVAPAERQNHWLVQRAHSTGGPNIITTTEDNKIHIHLGAPFIQGGSLQPVSPAHTAGPQDQGTPTKGHSKVTSSIVIKPTSTPIQRPSHITIPLEAFRRSGPTRIPKPRGYGSPKGTHNTGVCLGPQTTKGLKIRGSLMPGKDPLNPRTTTPTNPSTSSNHNNNPNLANRKL